jgi:hypothetical protein
VERGPPPPELVLGTAWWHLTPYSIIPSARSRIEGGMVSPSVATVFGFTVSVWLL